VQKTLTSFIDPANIPKKYGGELEFNFGDMPNPDPAWKDAVHWEGDFNTFPGGPLYWIHSDDNKLQAIATGSSHEQQRKQRVCIVSTAPATEDKAVNGHVVAGQEAKDAASQNRDIAATEGLDGLSLIEKLGSFPNDGAQVSSEDEAKLDVFPAADSKGEKGAREQVEA
jgi:hypothetical protein